LARRSNQETKRLAESRERHRGQVPDEWLDLPLTKSEANKADSKYYFTGDLCQKGHIALRWTASSKCLECAGYKDIPNAIHPYTEAEDEYLRKHYQTQTKAQMAAAIGRTPKSVEKRLLTVLKLTIDLGTRDSIRKQRNMHENMRERERHRGKIPDEWFSLPPSQQEAKKIGTEYFFTGLACDKGHIDIRGTNHGRCLACNRAKSILLNQDEQRKEWRRTYRKQDHVRTKNNDYRKRTLEEDPAFRLRVNTSARIANFFAGRKSAGKLETTEVLLGCSYAEFHLWIAQQMTEDMTMENYGFEGWHLDHVRPVMSFRDKNIDTDLMVQQVAFNWRNYQPLWGDQNQSKNDNWTPQMEADWVERMRSLGWEGNLFTCFE
jgi:hypothetical protein